VRSERARGPVGAQRTTREQTGIQRGTALRAERKEIILEALDERAIDGGFALM
jgi:hypothetical protein